MMSLAYINAVLNDWLGQNITTKDAIEAHLRDKADKKNKSSPGSGYKAPVNSFNSYTQRQYDARELEDRLLGRGKYAEDGREEAEET